MSTPCNSVICFSHFPISVNIQENNATIKNFLGEKIARKLTIPKGVDIKIDKDIITINSINKEMAGQAAANFEAVTRVGNRDRRIFQDGIYRFCLSIINKTAGVDHHDISFLFMHNVFATGF